MIESKNVGLPGYTNREYKVSPELEEKLKVASNKNNIKESINYHVTKLANNIKTYKENVRDVEKRVEKLQEELNEKQELLLDQEARRKYYNNLLDILDTPEQIEESCDDQCKKNDYVAPLAKDRIKELFDIDENTSLFSVLRTLGILK